MYESVGFDNISLIEPDSTTLPEFKIRISSAKCLIIDFNGFVAA